MSDETERIERLLSLPFNVFLDKCVQWKNETNTDLSDIDPERCPVHRRALTKGRCMRTVAGIALCPVCGNSMCPDCGNHCVEQLSRVTGYLSAVSGWNAAKTQELKDRTRYDVA